MLGGHTPLEIVKYIESKATLPARDIYSLIERAAEINETGLPGEIVYAYIDNLKAAGFKLPRDWAAEK